ncbi:MAG: cyclic pyranopterin monophosphate synthase MoaC [Terriglobales bacterium]
MTARRRQAKPRGRGAPAFRPRARSRSRLSHYRAGGGVHMVNVSAKPETYREAEARAFVVLRPAVLAALGRNPKGDPLEVARIAGIAGAKRTAELIPLCHTLPLSRIEVEARKARGGVQLTSRVGTTAATGVEMEALTAVSIAALTLYDMCKAMDHGIQIRTVELTRKSGGQSGDFSRRRAPARNAGTPLPGAARRPQPRSGGLSRTGRVRRPVQTSRPRRHP